MKRVIFILAVMLSVLTGKAQDATIDYIYSPDGFDIKEGIITVNFINQDRTFSSTGLYSKDGKVLVSAITTNGFGRFYVLDGCETICSGAFQSMTSTSVYIPSSVRYIAPDALNSLGAYGNSNLVNRFAGIQDGCYEDNTLSAPSMKRNDPEASETGRYSVNGMPLNGPADGINIIRKSDGSSEKIFVK